MSDNDRKLVQSVRRALGIMEVLGHSAKPQPLAEIAAEVDLPKTTVFRLLETLQHEGYVEQDEMTRQFTLSAKVLDLASAFLGSLDLRQVARPLLTDLWQRSHETVHLALIDDDEVLYIEKLESPHTIRMHSRVGLRAPMHCTGLGKSIMAHLPANEVDQIVERHGLHRYTDNSIVDRPALEEELARIRARGAAFDNEEHEINVRCVAAPLHNAQGKAIAAISISGPAFRMTPERQQEMAPWVIDAAQRISRRLGYVPAAEHGRPKAQPREPVPTPS